MKFQTAQDTRHEREPRQTIHRNSDGSITAAFAASNAFQVPGGGGSAFDVAQTVNIGPNVKKYFTN